MNQHIRDTFLPFSPPLIGEDEINEVVDALRTGWITTGPKVTRFEEEFSIFMGAPTALAINSGTAALHVALATLAIGPGDTVITTPMTFCSTVHVIEQVGAKPILVDVEPDTLNIDPNKIEEVLKFRIPNSEFRIRGLLPVHLYGHLCKMNAVSELALNHDLAAIDDSILELST
jgi:dTDP-4-amino-4,6-dideoxygalactose transaminase